VRQLAAALSPASLLAGLKFLLSPASLPAGFWKKTCGKSEAVVKNVAILAVLVLALAPRAFAQVSAGEAKLNLSGTLSAGYNDDYSNLAGSDHSFVFSGTADSSGYYYNPNFFSFDVQPFYNQSRDNSTFQSITSSSGVTAAAHIFGGSHYPGSISYNATFNGSGNYNLPGLGNYTTHGNNDTLGVTWGVHPEDLPTLDFSFSNTNSNYSIYGANAGGTLHADTFSVTSAYDLAGFRLNGGYQRVGSRTLTPGFLTDQPPQNTRSDINSYSFSVGRNLPGNGNISAVATRLDLSTDLSDVTSSNRYSTDIDTLMGSINFAPRPHLNVGANTLYTDNLEGTLYNSLLTTGVTVPQNEGQQSSHDLNLTGYANYELLAQHLNLHAFVERQQQSFLGISFLSNSYNGTASYANLLLGGSLTGTLGMTYTSLDTTHQSVLGVNSTVNYVHQVQRWTFTGGFGYSQGTQTVLISYTTSGYDYSGSVGRKFGRRSYWAAYANGARTLETGQPGSANSSQSYSTSFSFARYSLSGAYSKSSGNALLTSAGLVATPIPLPVINPADVILYNGRSYSVGLGAHPVHGLTLTATYAKALSDTQSNSTRSNNNNEILNFLATYNVRKLKLISGYTRLVQGFSVSGTPPTLAGSFYVGVSRWFNFF
jgi:hypothetical protein